MSFNIDIVIVIIFLAINLGVGLYYGRGVSTIGDYALGGRNFTTSALVSTIVATAVTGSLFTVGVSRTHSDGLYDLLPTCGFALSFLLLSRYFIPRMKSFFDDISIADSMGRYYGKHVRIITAVCAVAETIGFIAIQYKVFGNVLSYFWGTNVASMVILSGFIVTIYSAFGGIRSVTFTDVLQFMVFGTVIPLIGIVLWKTVISTENLKLISLTSVPHFDLKHVLNYRHYEFWDMVLLTLSFSIPSSSAAFQRIIMGSTLTQAKEAFSISSLLLLLIIIAVAWIGFLLYALKPELNSEQLIPYIIDNYSYVGFRGLVVVGVIAMALSSCDSFINIASVFAAHDICKPLGIGVNRELSVARVFAIIIGIGSIFLALLGDNLLGIILFANAFYMPIVVVPLLITILGFRTTTTTVLLGMEAGFLTVVIWKIKRIGFDPIIPAMLMNFLVMMIVHYGTKQEGGWIATAIDDGEDKQTKTSLMKFISTFSIAKFLYQNSPRSESLYSFFGVFCFISTICTIYLTQYELLGKHGNLTLYLYQIMLIISVFFSLHMMWSNRIRHPLLIGIMWHVALIYNMAFCSTFFVLMSKFHTIQIMVFTLSLIIIFNLCRWKTALTIIAIGMGSALLVYKNLIGPLPTHEMLDNNAHLILYSCLFVSTALIFFFKPTEEYVDQTEAELGLLKDEVLILSYKMDNKEQMIKNLTEDMNVLNDKVGFYTERVTDHEKEIERLGATSQKILNNVTHELRLPVGNVMNFAEMLSDSLDKMNKEQLKELSDEVLKNSKRLSTMILNMLDLATLDIDKVRLNRKTMNLGELVTERVKKCSKLYLDNKPIDIKLTLQPEVLVPIDPNYMRQVVDNLVINAIKFSEKGLIEVRVTRNIDSAILIVKDEGRGIARHELYDLFTPFKMGGGDNKAEGRGVGLALCRSAVRAHGGRIDVQSAGIGAMFTVILPLKPFN
ncbi:MAG: hypothetical protein H6909_00490 [Rickettsiaceae bacterium]|nr:hypothetical protein [Rickettsiaceae bacterium]